jgi:hypothetical protein
MQDLGQFGAHPLAHACRKDHDVHEVGSVMISLISGGFRGIFSAIDRSTRPIRSAALGLAVCLAVSGCASVGRLGYDNFSTLALWRLDGYVSLTPDQRYRAGRGFESLLAWHRATQLDDYAQWLRGVKQHVASGSVTESDIRGWREDIARRATPLVDRAALDVAQVAATLDAGQMNRLRTELARDNDKMRKEWMPPGQSERVAARTKRYLDRAEFFLGSLTDSQKQLARRMAAEAPPAEDSWYAQRLGRQKDLIALIDRIRTEQPGDAVAAVWVKEHFLRYTQWREGPDRQSVESSLASGDAMTAALFAQATPRQRDHLQRKLQDWIDLTESLRPAKAASGPVAPVTPSGAAPTRSVAQSGWQP